MTLSDRPLTKIPIKRAALSHDCILCQGKVEQGEEIWPVIKQGGASLNPGGRKVSAHAWCHLQCAKDAVGGGELVPPVCPHWLKKGSCGYGELCFYLHPVEGLEELRKQLPDRKRIGSWKRSKLRNSSKVGSFRRWLLDHFSLDELAAGTGILDIAGGKGELAFELANLNKLPTTVVDPRPLELSSYRRKLLYSIYWRNPLMHMYIDPSVSADSQPVSPTHLRLFFDAPLLSHVLQHEEKEGQEWQEFFTSSVRRSKEFVWTTKGLKPSSEETADHLYPRQKARQEDDAGAPSMTSVPTFAHAPAPSETLMKQRGGRQSGGGEQVGRRRGDRRCCRGSKGSPLLFHPGRHASGSGCRRHGGLCSCPPQALCLCPLLCVLEGVSEEEERGRQDGANIRGSGGMAQGQGPQHTRGRA